MTVVIRYVVEALLLIWLLTLFAGARRETDGKYEVRHVTTYSVNATSITIKWAPPVVEEIVNCSVIQYIIRLKQQYVKKTRSWKIDGSRTVVTLHDLLPSIEYKVRITAVGCRGKGKPSPWVRMVSGEHMMDDAAENGNESREPGKPMSLRTRTFPNSVIVTWLPPDDDVIVRGYMIGYGEGIPDVSWYYTDANSRNATLRNLKPGTQYVISLRAFNNFGKGEVIYDLIYTREEDKTTFHSSPTELRVKILTPTTAWVQWTDQSLGHHQLITDNRYYNLQYTSVSSGKTHSVVVKSLHVVVYNLMPGTLYEFRVRTVKNSLTSSFSTAVQNRTFETAPGTPPRNITVLLTEDSSSVQVFWHPPEFPNGNITGYLVLFTKNYKLQSNEWNMKATKGDSNNLTITNLQPGNLYYFRIQAQNSNGYGPMSDIVSFFLQQDQDNFSTSSSTLYHQSPSTGSDIQAQALPLVDPLIEETDASSPGLIVPFRSIVKHSISAFLTWPETPAPCHVNQSNSELLGYLLRYYRVLDDDEQATETTEYHSRNLFENVALLEDLEINSRYICQIKYVFKDGSETAWSGKGSVVT